MTQHSENEPTEPTVRAQESPSQPHNALALRLAVRAQPMIVLTVLVDELV